ncbi:hypothetical protein K4K59_001390 [Colletotrichum sp. SAR11_240]|nr:hypothetical protein K4K59_001390 [Colletotrichum sp. SAR11_240]
MATINISGIAIPRLCFGVGTLMKWAPGHTHPLPTDSSVEIQQAIDAGFRHFNTGDIYTNNDSFAKVLRHSNLKRSEIFLSLKINTYALLGCRGRDHMIQAVKREVERFGILEVYVDILQLHFPPRGYAGNMTNREAWRVLEDLKDQGIARIVGVSNWTLPDYHDIFNAIDLKHPPQLNEYEFNPFLLSDPQFRQLREFEVKHNVVAMNYGILTAINGRLASQDNTALSKKLEEQSKQTNLSTADLLLSWAYYRLGGILVTSTSKADRARKTFELLSAKDAPVNDQIYEEIEKAAALDGPEGKVFYGHPHMEKARQEHGKYEAYDIEAHRNGSRKIVRIGPGMYSIDDPAMARVIYGISSPLPKSKWYDAWGDPRIPNHNLFSARDRAVHGLMRRKVASMYSMSTIKSYEPYVDSCVALLLKRFDEFAESGETFDLQQWMQCYAFDVIGEITFGRRVGFLESGGQDVDGIMRGLENANAFSTLSGVNAVLLPILLLLYGNPVRGIASFARKLQSESDEIDMKEKHGGETFLAKVQRLRKEDPEEYEKFRIRTITLTGNVAAGSDTTSISLTSALYHLLTTNGVAERMYEELDSQGFCSSLDEHITFDQAQQLPYLQMVIKEALRLHPAVGLPMWREVVGSGLDVDGTHFPPGAIIGVNPWVAHRNTDVFGTNAADFVPERWDPKHTSSGTLAAMEQYYLPFGAGARTCIGKHISHLEMVKLIPELVRRYEFKCIKTAQPFSVPVLFTELDHEPKNAWVAYGPSERRLIAKGWAKEEGRKSFAVDTVWEKDVRIPLRDGVELLADVFRPLTSDDEPVPAIMPWSPYGKTGTGMQQLDMFPWRVGVPRSATSGLEKWEAPDPAEWVARGYAVVNIDARGSFKSGGNLHVYGTQEGRDGYDCIEWIAQQTWCNKRVAMAGNSWLATTQWFIAAEQPPHLTCMAPWEGLGDYYRESICRGGIPDHAFWDVLMGWACGPGLREDVGAMVEKYGIWNDYWEDKKPKLRNITVPMYATASFSTGLHTEGSVRGFQLSRSSEKWLRWTTTQEWHDIYKQENLDDLQRFFDKYMLNKDNGWETTPRIRYSLLGYNRPSIVNEPASQFPPAKFMYETLFLDATNGALGHRRPSTEGVVEYQADSPSDDGCSFLHTFEEYTELCGVSKAKVFMSTVDHNDVDVYVVLRKLDKNGKALWHQNIPMEDLPKGTTVDDIPNENIWQIIYRRYIGPNGRLRASHRAIANESLEGLDQDAYMELMGPAYVHHPHTAPQALRRGEVVELEISLWSGGMIFDAGESMRLEVKGRLPIVPEFEGLDKRMVNYNVGRHRLHTGGKYESQFLVNLWRSGK